MDRSEMLKMLGLDDALPSSGPATPAITRPGRAVNDHAMKTDLWTDRRGTDLYDEREDRGYGPTGIDMADFHAALFDPEPVLLEGCADRKKHAYLVSLLDTPDYKALRATTTLGEAETAAAAQRFGDAWARLKKSKPSMPDPSATERARETERLRDDMGTDTAVFEALDGAAEEIAAIRDLVGACGGMGAGPLGGKPDPMRVTRIYNRIKRSKTLRALMEDAGRFRLSAQSTQRQKTIHGVDDMIGVTLAGEIARLVPAELCKLMLEETEIDTIRRLLERQAMCLDYRSVEPIGAGPIICVIDESGSMYGRKVHEAKALALALAWIARKQKRWCGLIAYSGNTGHRLLTLPPTGWDEEVLLDWLEGFLSGGSCLDIPVREMPEFYVQIGAPKGKTDVIFTTDAICNLHPYDRDRFNSWKKEVNARLITLVLGLEGGDLSSISDEVHYLPAIEPDGDAVRRVLSL